jgi:hypothetical protein
LALSSVFIVVLFSLVINTIVAKGPIIFLKMAQASYGEVDGVVTPSQTTSLGLREDQTMTKYLNYTRLKEIPGMTKFNLSPRKTFLSVPFASDSSNPSASKAEWLSALNDTTGLPSREELQKAKI